MSASLIAAGILMAAVGYGGRALLRARPALGELLHRAHIGLSIIISIQEIYDCSSMEVAVPK